MILCDMLGRARDKGGMENLMVGMVMAWQWHWSKGARCSGLGCLVGLKRDRGQGRDPVWPNFTIANSDLYLI